MLPTPILIAISVIVGVIALAGGTLLLLSGGLSMKRSQN